MPTRSSLTGTGGNIGIGNAARAAPDGHTIVLVSSSLKERLDAIGFVPVANTPDEFAAVIKAETTRWGKVIRDANLAAD